MGDVMKRSGAIAAIGGALAFTQLPARAQALTKVRVLATAIDTSGAVFYAKELGYFEKAGLDVDITTPNDNSATVAAVISGAAEIGYVNVAQIEQAFKRGLPIAIAAAASLSNVAPNNTDYLLVPKSSTVRTAKDLEGKTLGVSPLKSLGDYAIDAWMQANGADSTKLSFVEIPYTLLEQSMIAGRIDGCFSVEPYATQARATTRTFCHPFTVFGMPFVSAAYCVNRQWGEANATTVRQFEGAIRRACAWGNANHAQSGQILAKYSHMDTDTIRAMMRCPYPEKLDQRQFQVTVDFLAKNKMIDGGFPAQSMFLNPSA